MRDFKINKYAVADRQVVCFKSIDKVAAFLKLVKDEYICLVDSDGVGNYFVYLQNKDAEEFGSERFMWVTAEEEEYLRDVRLADDVIRARNLIDTDGSAAPEDEEDDKISC